MHRLLACLATIACPLSMTTTATAQELSFDGLWRSNPTTECVSDESATGALKVEDGTLYGAENTCQMTNPVNVRDMNAVLYDMECEGEGDSYTERAMFLEAADGGLYLVWNGFAFKYESCEAPTGGAVITSDQIGITD